MSLSTSTDFHPSVDDINLLVNANHWNPFSVLGLHEVGSGDSRGWVVRALLPEARDAWVIDLSEGEPGVRLPMERIHADGLFEYVFSRPMKRFQYRLAVENLRGIPLGVR